MALRFFVVPALNSAIAEQDLNGFLASHKVVLIERRLIDQGVNSFWAICVDYRALPPPFNLTAYSVFSGPATALALSIWASRTCAGNICPRVPPRGRGKSSSRARKTKSFKLFRCLHPNASLLRNVLS